MNVPGLGFRVKVCGLTQREDAARAAACGADALGVVLWSGSARGVDTERATAVFAGAPGDVARVGVFVDASRDDVERAVACCRLDYVQLAGDEPAEFAAVVRERTGARVLRVVRIGPDATVDVALDAADGIVLDTGIPGLRGGTGRAFDWEQAARSGFPRERLVLAGGLRPSTVAHAIARVRPAAVDVASGVESAPGIKDPTLLHDFITAARSGFDRCR